MIQKQTLFEKNKFFTSFGFFLNTTIDKTPSNIKNYASNKSKCLQKAWKENYLPQLKSNHLEFPVKNCEFNHIG